MSSSPPSRPTSETRLSLSHITAQNETNLLGTVHGGVVMTLVDSVAGVVAARHSGGPAVTASMDEMVFLVPVRVGDVVHFSAQVNWTGRSSMEVGVRITADRWDAVGPQVHVASAYLVFVAVDEDGKPREVPQVVPVTDEDRRRLREAGIRRSHRLARRAAIIASREEAAHEEAAQQDAAQQGTAQQEAAAEGGGR
ncbi:acyl-CoA thioesterase [Kribbella sp. NBC_00709]|uniref:acyl-CoA thioesterase n=1 Tax=Kribbella sp. NBC_00709 TaxID=2975972 RepID=UPI002E2C8079|nr:acyl-CoA thioesterase [Kribbella sp. NBC_00709]